MKLAAKLVFNIFFQGEHFYDFFLSPRVFSAKKKKL